MTKLRELKLKNCWHCDNDRYLQTDKSFMLVCSNCGTYYSDRNDPELFTSPEPERVAELEKEIVDLRLLWKIEIDLVAELKKEVDELKGIDIEEFTDGKVLNELIDKAQKQNSELKAEVEWLNKIIEIHKQNTAKSNELYYKLRTELKEMEVEIASRGEQLNGFSNLIDYMQSVFNDLKTEIYSDIKGFKENYLEANETTMVDILNVYLKILTEEAK